MTDNAKCQTLNTSYYLTSALLIHIPDMSMAL